MGGAECWVGWGRDIGAQGGWTPLGAAKVESEYQAELLGWFSLRNNRKS